MPVFRGRPPHLAALVAVALVLLVAGCTEHRPAQSQPVLPTSSPTALPELVGDRQQLNVRIEEGRFSSDRYAVQPHGQVRMVVETRGGPYTLQIDQVVGATQIQADGPTEIHFASPGPGDYTMSVRGQTEHTAVLNVRPVGGR